MLEGHDPIRERRIESLRKGPLLFSERKMVRELEGPILSIVEQLRPEIEKGEYKLILGDDASGRIPTFIIGHVCKTIYEANNMRPPLVRPIAGSSKLNRSDENKKLNMVAAQIGKMKATATRYFGNDLGKVLIMTDTITGGSSVGVLIEALRENDWKADVATIGITPGGKIKKTLERDWDSRIVYAMEGTPEIYGRTNLSGVIQDRTWTSAKNKEKKDTENNDEEKNNKEIEKAILFAKPLGSHHDDETRAARALSQDVADRIAHEFLSGKGSPRSL